MLPITRSGPVKHNMPSGKPPANKKPANKKPVNKKPVNKKPANKTPVNKTPVNKNPANKKEININGQIPLENIRCVKTPIHITSPIIVK